MLEQILSIQFSTTVTWLVLLPFIAGVAWVAAVLIKIHLIDR